MILQTIYTIVNLKDCKASRAKTGSIAVGIYRNFRSSCPHGKNKKAMKKACFLLLSCVVGSKRLVLEL